MAVPDIQETFTSASTADVSWVLTFYMLTYAGLLITAGRIADRFGRLRVLNAGLICFVVGAGLAVVAPLLPLLIAARGVMGLGVAMMAPASLGLAVAAWPAERRATAVAVWSSTLALSSAVGPVVGGVLIEAGSWRWAFAVNVPIGLLAFVWGRRVLSESAKDPEARTPDVVGAVLLGLATAGLALAIVQGREWGWTSPAVIGLFILTVVSIAVVVRRTATHPNPIVPRSLLAVSSFRVATVSVFLFGLGFFATFLALVLYLTEIADYSTVQAGVAIIMLPITATVVANFPGGWPTAMATGRSPSLGCSCLLLAHCGSEPMLGPTRPMSSICCRGSSSSESALVPGRPSWLELACPRSVRRISALPELSLRLLASCRVLSVLPSWLPFSVAPIRPPLIRSKRASSIWLPPPPWRAWSPLAYQPDRSRRRRSHRQPEPRAARGTARTGRRYGSWMDSDRDASSPHAVDGLGHVGHRRFHRGQRRNSGGAR